MYIQCNIVVCLHNHCCSGHATMHFIFYTLSHKRHNCLSRFIEHKMCVMTLSSNLPKKFLIVRQIQKTHYHKCTWAFKYSTCYSCQLAINLEFSQQIFEQSANIKFHEKLSSGSHAVPSEWTDMVKLRVTFCDVVNVPKYCTLPYFLCSQTCMLRYLLSSGMIHFYLI